MAPRGRPRKRGSRRIDAALDAMRLYGFSQKLVRETIEELLHVYGGEDGWVFVEEASYTLLIEAILEKQNNGAIIEKNEKENEDNPDTSAACGSSGFNESFSSNLEATEPGLQNNEVLDSASRTDEVLNLTIQPHCSGIKNYLSPREGGGWKDINLDETSGKKQTDDISSKNRKDSTRFEHLQSAPINFPNSINKLKGQKRKPYYGWICKDGEEDVVELVPAPFPEAFTKLLLLSLEQKKRKKRWDVKPADM